MFDLESYANGFGIVFVPFVVGVIIRSALATINAGSIRSKFYMIPLFLFLTFPTISHSGQFTGKIESYSFDGATLSITNKSVQYHTFSPEITDILITSFNNSYELTVTFDDLTNQITQVFILAQKDLYSRITSFFLGGIACSAFALGISLRI